MPTLHRLQSIDLMRGFVIALMALDHTRDFFSNELIDPTDLSRTNAALFLTRWITHICAPTFVFLAGTGAYLSVIRHAMTSRQLGRYLFTRGLWLVVLELTLVHFGWTFNWDIHHLFGQVIWTLGWSMIVLAGLNFLPRPVILLFALLMITGHNLFDTVQPGDLHAWGWLWTLLHVPGTIEFLPGYSFFLLYPLIPWAGVMALGYCFGPALLQPEQARKTVLLVAGFVCIAAFLALRLPNIYGDAHPWMQQKDSVFTFLSILNCEKYPPSLLYLLMTLGMMFIGLRLFESSRLQRLGRPLIVFGKVAMFFYLVHLLVIHSAILIITWLRGFPVDWLFQAPFPSVPKVEYGYDLIAVYGFWLLFLLILYPICHAYALLKQKYPKSLWTSYL